MEIRLLFSGKYCPKKYFFIGKGCLYITTYVTARNVGMSASVAISASPMASSPFSPVTSSSTSVSMAGSIETSSPPTHHADVLKKAVISAVSKTFSNTTNQKQCERMQKLMMLRKAKTDQKIVT
jgi:hypothetical protein